jgi:hypothetical protein
VARRSKKLAPGHRPRSRLSRWPRTPQQDTKRPDIESQRESDWTSGVADLLAVARGENSEIRCNQQVESGKAKRSARGADCSTRVIETLVSLHAPCAHERPGVHSITGNITRTRKTRGRRVVWGCVAKERALKDHAAAHYVCHDPASQQVGVCPERSTVDSGCHSRRGLVRIPRRIVQATPERASVRARAVNTPRPNGESLNRRRARYRQLP